MSTLHLEYLNRNDYLASIDTIGDVSTQRFAAQSLRWWDRHYSWKPYGCIVLCHGPLHLSYVFFIIDRYHEYVTVHNIFTPEAYRRQGYALTLLGKVFARAREQKVRRVRLSSVSGSLDFYLAHGFIYWGITSARDYYCDLPLPASGLQGLDIMVQDTSLKKLLGSRSESIFRKVQDNQHHLDASQAAIYRRDTEKMGDKFRYDALKHFMAAP